MEGEIAVLWPLTASGTSSVVRSRKASKYWVRS